MTDVRIIGETEHVEQVLDVLREHLNLTAISDAYDVRRGDPGRVRVYVTVEPHDPTPAPAWWTDEVVLPARHVQPGWQIRPPVDDLPWVEVLRRGHGGAAVALDVADPADHICLGALTRDETDDVVVRLPVDPTTGWSAPITLDGATLAGEALSGWIVAPADTPGDAWMVVDIAECGRGASCDVGAGDDCVAAVATARGCDVDASQWTTVRATAWGEMHLRASGPYTVMIPMAGGGDAPAIGGGPGEAVGPQAGGALRGVGDAGDGGGEPGRGDGLPAAVDA